MASTKTLLFFAYCYAVLLAKAVGSRHGINIQDKSKRDDRNINRRSKKTGDPKEVWSRELDSVLNASRKKVYGRLSIGLWLHEDASHNTAVPSRNFPSYSNFIEMVVFGDSISDRRRRFDAPANFDFEDIGVYPWKEVFTANDTEDMVNAYIRGSVTNGKAWAEWLGVDKELNFATASASMTDSFRSLEKCTGYTGEGDDFPTGTFDEQIDLYLHDMVSKASSTLGYTHVIIFGGNDINHLLAAFTRYAIGLALEESGALEEPYEDPVAFENVFEIVDSIPQLTLDPLLTDLSTALSDGVGRLLEAGVTGRILVGNVLSVRGIPDDPEQVDFFDSITLTVNEEISAVVESNEQLRLLDIYTTFASIVDNPDVWTELGFVAPEDEETGEALPFGTPCFQSNFDIDHTAEIMGTQALRASGCQEECAICADDTSPCQTCYIGNPSATICDNPDTRFFWDSVHPTTAVHSLLAQAIRECSGEEPDYDKPIVEMMCPGIV